MNRRFIVGLLATVVAAAVILVLPLFLSDTHEYRFAFVATFFVAALGLQILTGYAGLISLGRAASCSSARTTTILSVDHGWDDLLTIPVAGLLAGIAASSSASRAPAARCLPRARDIRDPDRGSRCEEVLRLHRRRGGKNLTRVLTGTRRT
jgi:ABC-type branched-subunit amino acid transport system permease subunit